MRTFTLSLTASLILILSLPVQAKQTLRFCQGEMPPYIFKQQGEKPVTGIWPTVFQEVFKHRADITIESVVLPWKRCQKEVLYGKSDGFYMATKTPKRANDYLLLPSFHTLRIPYYYSTKAYPQGFIWDSYNDLKNKTVGILRGYTYFADFHEAWDNKQLNAEYGDDIEINLKKLLNGRLDLVWDCERIVNYHLQKIGITNTIKESTGKHHIHEVGQHIGLSKTGKAIKYSDFIIKRLNEMQTSGELARIVNQDYSKY